MTKTRRNAIGLPISTTDWRAMTNRDRYVILMMLACNPPTIVAAERFHVTARTIQKWRTRLGLPHPDKRYRTPIMTTGQFRAMSIKSPLGPGTIMEVEFDGEIYPVTGCRIDQGQDGDGKPVYRVVLETLDEKYRKPIASMNGVHND